MFKKNAKFEDIQKGDTIRVHDDDATIQYKVHKYEEGWTKEWFSKDGHFKYSGYSTLRVDIVKRKKDKTALESFSFGNNTIQFGGGYVSVEDSIENEIAFPRDKKTLKAFKRLVKIMEANPLV